MAIINGKYREYKLENGLVVALQNTLAQTISAKLRVNYGSSHEKKGEEGMAHFLEHCLVTGGSKKYDPKTADEIRDSFGCSNACTNVGQIYFLGEVLTEDLGMWLNFVSDHALRPRLNRERVNGERERVLREISDAKSDPIHVDNQKLNRIFYRGHPKGRFNLGKEKIVKDASIGEIRKFHSKGFHPNNMDLILVGNLPENTEKFVEKNFGAVSKGQNTRKKFPKIKPLQKKTILYKSAQDLINLEDSEESSAQILLAYIAPIATDPDTYAVGMMSHILGGGSNSHLFKNMGLKKGLAYDVSTSYNHNFNGGVLSVYASVPAKKIEESVKAIFEDIEIIKTQKVNNKLLEKIRKKIKYSLLETFDSNEGYVSAIERKLDKKFDPKSQMESYKNVTPEKIMEVANKYLQDREKGNYVLRIRDPFKK